MKKVFLTFLLFSGFANAQTLEISVVTDWETVSYYGSVDETKQAIDPVFEYAATIFSNQLNITNVITIVDVPATESEDTIANHTHAVSLMDSLFDYVNSNEEHYSADVTVLVTKRDLAIGGQDLAGYAKIKSICSASSIAIIELTDNGLDGQTLAHELAHVLGAVHDGDVPCESTPNRGYLMSSAIHTGNDNFSACSINTINTTIDVYGSCMFPNEVPDTPIEITPVPRSGGGSVSMLFLLMLSLTYILQRRVSR